jgi:hypothetical protein
MNERILELAKEAGIYQLDQFNTVSGGNQISMFTELLLEEVMQELFINGYEDAFDFLNKHFGVEE